MRLLFTLLLLMVNIPLSLATIRYVKSTASGSGNGLSWANASSDLQAMINTSSSGDEIWVARGTYYPTRDHLGNTTPTNPRTKTFLLKPGVNLYGGFAGNETNIATRNIYANTTTLSGDIGTAHTSADNCYHVLLIVNLSINTGCIVDGITIKEGIANGTAYDTVSNILIYQNSGGGIYAHNGQNILRNIIADSNYAAYSGGGIHLYLGNHTIRHDSLHNNTSSNSGGGLGTDECSFVVDSNAFYSNTAADGGGLALIGFNDTISILRNNAIYNNAASAGGGLYVRTTGMSTIVSNSFFNNTSSNWGGGAFFDGGNFTHFYVYNNAIFKNTSPSGGGIYVNDGNGTYINNTFLRNSGTGGSIYLLGGNGNFYNNIFWKNTGDFILMYFGTNLFKNNLLQGKSTSYLHSNGGSTNAIGANASGNIYGYDPVLVNDTLPLGPDGIPNTSDDGIALTSCSPPINAGVTPNPTLPKDIRGNSRVGTYDMGAYEYQSTPQNIVLLPPIKGSSLICLNDTTTYTNDTTGGKWFSVDTSIASIDSLSGLITSKDTGSVNIYYKVGNNSCPSNITYKQITITTPPYAAPITGNDTMCSGGTLVLSSASSKLGYWYSSNTSIATTFPSSQGNVSKGYIYGWNGGNVTITFTVTNGCARSTTKDIYVRRMPVVDTITGSNKVCVGDTIHVHNATTGGTWNVQASSRNTITSSGVITSKAQGFNKIFYTVIDTFGCGTTVNYDINNYALPYVNQIQGADTICMLSSTNFTNFTSGGIWSSSNTSIATVDINGLIKGISSGQASINYTITNVSGCSTTVSKSIYVKAATLLNAISGKDSICLNDTEQYYNNTSGGIWSTLSNGAVSGISTFGLLSANNAGNDTITYTVTNTSGCITSQEKHITVKTPQYVPIIGVDSICVGDKETFTNTISGGSWSNTNTNYGNINSTGKYLSNNAGVDTIQYSYVSNGCPAEALKKLVIQKQDSATITGDTSICIDQIIQLSQSISGGIWKSNNYSVAEIDNNGIVKGLDTGQVIMTYTITNKLGCIGLSSHELEVNKAIVSTSVNGVTLTATGNQKGATYQWFNCNNNQPIVSATQDTYTATSNGLYAVIVTYKGCTDTSSCVTISGVNIKAFNTQSDISISPNPANEYVYVKTGNIIAASIKVFDIAGKLINEIKPHNSLTSINVQNYSRGIYTIHILLNNKLVTGRFNVL